MSCNGCLVHSKLINKIHEEDEVVSPLFMSQGVIHNKVKYHNCSETCTPNTGINLCRSRMFIQLQCTITSMLLDMNTIHLCSWLYRTICYILKMSLCCFDNYMIQSARRGYRCHKPHLEGSITLHTYYQLHVNQCHYCILTNKTIGVHRYVL